MILITSPPACGKTTLAKKLAKELQETVYLDKDTLIPLSKKIFEVANEEYNRSSEFFETHIRDLEYKVILDLAFEAIEYDSHVIINAPFGREIRDKQYIEKLREKLKAYNGELKVIWIECSPEVAHKRMIERNSERDTWKLEHWDEYVKTENFNAPDIENLLIYKNNTEEEAEESFKDLLNKL
ncbi:ATP-binding protein [Clostridium sp. DJ247]|nr:ATP-binding protein [Clostridium sp. DJ247]